MTLRHSLRLLPDLLLALKLLAGFCLLTFAFLSFFFILPPLFLLFLKVCGMERHDFRLEGELLIFLQLIPKLPLLLHQAAHVMGVGVPFLRILRLEQGMLL